MIKVLLTVILLSFLVLTEEAFAQEPAVGIKIFSGYLHQVNSKSRHSLFGGDSSKEEEILQDRQCFIEFKSPVSFSLQEVAVEPEEISYFIKFVNLHPIPAVSTGSAAKDKDPFEKFVIKVYTKDDEEYYIDPYSEGRQIGINDEHHISDTYLIYLILGAGIDHLEILSLNGKSQSKYVLDKIEVHDLH